MKNDMKMVIESLQEIKASLNEVKTNQSKLDERITTLEKGGKVSTAKTSAPQKSSTTTKSSKKTSTKQAKVDPKDFAPKSLTSYKSVKTARAKFAQAVTGKQWVDRDVFLKAVKPFDEEFGTWVAGKGLCK